MEEQELNVTVLSDGCVAGPGGVEKEERVCSGAHSWLVPAMLSPPESLLVSCIRRGNFMEAHEVSTTGRISTRLAGLVMLAPG